MAPLRFGLVAREGGGVSFGVAGSGDFGADRSDEPTMRAHVAFDAEDPAAVDAFHTAALAAGGGDRSAPAVKPEYHPGYYAAFVWDPNGNNIETVYHDRP